MENRSFCENKKKNLFFFFGGGGSGRGGVELEGSGWMVMEN